MGTRPFDNINGSSKISRTTLKGATKEEQRLFGTEQRYLEIEHVPTGYKVRFSAFIENFSDAYNSEWSAEQVYGRMDPIATYMHTRRAIAVSWIVPAASSRQAKNNLSEVGKLISFLYPLYSSNNQDSSVINMAPLVRVHFGNLIQDSETGKGLLGYLNGFTTDVDFTDMGVFSEHDKTQQNPDEDFVRGPNDFNEYYPKSIRLNFEMNVLHEHKLGWTIGEQGKATFRAGKKGFPYGDKFIGPPSVGFEVRSNRAQSTNKGDTIQQAQQQEVLGDD